MGTKSWRSDVECVGSQGDCYAGDVSLECEKRVERMSAFTSIMSGGVGLCLQTSKGLDCLYLFRFMGYHQQFGLIGGHSINRSYISE